MKHMSMQQTAMIYDELIKQKTPNQSQQQTSHTHLNTLISSILLS